MSILIIRLIIRKMIVSVNQYHHADRGNHLMKVRYQKFLDKFEMGQCHHSHFRIRSCSDHCSNKHSWRIRKLNMFETQGSYSTSSIVQMLSICALNLKVFKVLITSWKYARTGRNDLKLDTLGIYIKQKIFTKIFSAFVTSQQFGISSFS